MTTIKLLSTGLIAAVLLSTPAVASKNRLAKRRVAEQAYASAFAPIRHVDLYVRIPAPRVGSFATPPSGKNCDAGDNPFIC